MIRQTWQCGNVANDITSPTDLPHLRLSSTMVDLFSNLAKCMESTQTITRDLDASSAFTQLDVLISQMDWLGQIIVEQALVKLHGHIAEIPPLSSTLANAWSANQEADPPMSTFYLEESITSILEDMYVSLHATLGALEGVLGQLEDANTRVNRWVLKGNLETMLQGQNHEMESLERQLSSARRRNHMVRRKRLRRQIVTQCTMPLYHAAMNCILPYEVVEMQENLLIITIPTVVMRSVLNVTAQVTGDSYDFEIIDQDNQGIVPQNHVAAQVYRAVLTQILTNFEPNAVLANLQESITILTAAVSRVDCFAVDLFRFSQSFERVKVYVQHNFKIAVVAEMTNDSKLQLCYDLSDPRFLSTCQPSEVYLIQNGVEMSPTTTNLAYVLQHCHV